MGEFFKSDELKSLVSLVRHHWVLNLDANKLRNFALCKILDNSDFVNKISKKNRVNSNK